MLISELVSSSSVISWIFKWRSKFYWILNWRNFFLSNVSFILPQGLGVDISELHWNILNCWSPSTLTTIIASPPLSSPSPFIIWWSPKSRFSSATIMYPVNYIALFLFRITKTWREVLCAMLYYLLQLFTCCHTTSTFTQSLPKIGHTKWKFKKKVYLLTVSFKSNWEQKKI